MTSSRFRSCISPLIVILAAACGGANGADDAASNGDGLPTLTFHHESATLETSPTSIMSRVVIGPNGEVAMPVDQESDRLILVVDSLGAVRAELGKRGSGPGEMRMAHLVAVDGESITAFDQMQSRLVVMGYDDSVRTQVTFTKMIVPLHVSKDGLLGLGMETDGWRLARASMATGDVTDVVPATDTFMTANFPRSMPTSMTDIQAMVIPAVGMWGDRLVVANGHTYRLMVYGADGKVVRTLSRDIPPAVLGEARIAAEVRMAKAMMARMGVTGADEEMETLLDMRRKMKVPHFGMNGMMTDHAGRGWVVGSVGDSAFADIFTEAGFAGRLGIPCHAFSDVWHLNGPWLAMVCAPDDPEDDRDAVLKVFRIS